MTIEVPQDPTIQFTYFLDRFDPPLTYSNNLLAYEIPKRFLNEQVKLIIQHSGDYLVAIDCIDNNRTESLTIRTTNFKLAHFYFHGFCSRKNILLNTVQKTFPEMFI